MVRVGDRVRCAEAHGSVVGRLDALLEVVRGEAVEVSLW